MTNPLNEADRPTDLEQFKRMLKGTDSEEKHPFTDYGETVSVVFKVLAGTAGSDTSLGEAFFEKKTGKFLGIHHCD